MGAARLQAMPNPDMPEGPSTCGGEIKKTGISAGLSLSKKVALGGLFLANGVKMWYNGVG